MHASRLKDEPKGATISSFVAWPVAEKEPDQKDRGNYCLNSTPSLRNMHHRKAKQSSSDNAGLAIHAVPFDGATDSTISPTDENLNPTKAERINEYSSKKSDIDPAKKHVSVSVPGDVKPKATSKKKKQVPTVVSRCSLVNFVRRECFSRCNNVACKNTKSIVCCIVCRTSKSKLRSAGRKELRDWTCVKPR